MIARFLKWLKAATCRHGTVKVVRYHRSTVTPMLWGKELYVDVYRVHNFVRCTKCGTTLNTEQRERLHAQEPVDD